MASKFVGWPEEALAARVKRLEWKTLSNLMLISYEFFWDASISPSMLRLTSIWQMVTNGCVRKTFSTEHNVRMLVLSGVNLWVIVLNYPPKVARTERGNARGSATKVRALFTHFLTQKYTPLSNYVLQYQSVCQAFWKLANTFRTLWSVLFVKRTVLGLMDAPLCVDL